MKKILKSKNWENILKNSVLTTENQDEMHDNCVNTVDTVDETKFLERLKLLELTQE